jgi:hypothetical protein
LKRSKYEPRQHDNTAALVYLGVAVDRGGGDLRGFGAAFKPEANGRILCGPARASELPGLWGVERLFAAAGAVTEAAFAEKESHERFEDNTAKRIPRLRSGHGLTVPPLLVKQFLQKNNEKRES